MSFQGELRANYQGNAEYLFSATRIEKAATEILQIVKTRMLNAVKLDRVEEWKTGFWGMKKEKRVVVGISIWERSREKNTPCVYSSEEQTSWIVHDKKERQALFKVLSKKCIDDDIRIEEYRDGFRFSSTV